MHFFTGKNRSKILMTHLGLVYPIKGILQDLALSFALVENL